MAEHQNQVDPTDAGDILVGIAEAAGTDWSNPWHWVALGIVAAALVGAGVFLKAYLTKKGEQAAQPVDVPVPQPSEPEEPALAPGERISLAKLPATSADLFGREEQLKALDAAWADPKMNVVTLVAFGGVGKTALVNKWLLGLGEEDYRGAERVYGWSFYSQGAAEGKQASADLFVVAALRWFDDPNPDEGSPWDKGDRLANLVNEQRTLLILDGLEPLQFPPGEAGNEGRLKDPGMQSLVRGLARHNKGLCVIATRIAVDDIQEFVGTGVHPIDLDQLSPEAGTQLLKSLGVNGTGGELKQAVRQYGGHALALTLLGSYLATAHGGEIRERDKIARLTKEPKQGAHARRVMAAYEGWFEGKPEQNILRIMGLFDRPAPGDAIEALRADPAIEGLTTELVGMPDDDWQFALHSLRDARLVTEADPNEPETLDAHPLVREHFGERLRKKHAEAWREGNDRLYEHFKGVPEKDLPDTLKEMAPLYAAVAHGCAAGLHLEAFVDVYLRRISRGKEFFSTKKLGAFGAELAALAGFFDSPWDKLVAGIPKALKGGVLNLVGFRLRALGRLKEAAQPMQAALASSIAETNWEHAAIDASNVSELYLTIGDVAKAVNYARQSVGLADRSGVAFQRMGKRATLADALHLAGRIAKAEDLFREAEAMQKERQPEFPVLYSVQGSKFCHLLLDQGKHREVQDRAAQTLEWVKQAPGASLFDVALNHLSLGRAHFAEAQQEGTGDFSEAAEHLDQAVVGLRQAGTQHHIPRGLLARAELHRVRSDFDRARRDLEEAMSIAERGDMGLHQADAHLEFARLDLDMGDKAKAREHLATAKEMIERMGYHRRDGEVAELEGQLKG